MANTKKAVNEEAEQLSWFPDEAMALPEEAPEQEVPRKKNETKKTSSKPADADSTSLPSFEREKPTTSADNAAPKKQKKPKQKSPESASSDSQKLLKDRNAGKHSGSKGAKAVYVACMILLSPVILAVCAVVLAFFALLYAAAILIVGLLALAFVAIVVAGVVVALVGIIYGLMQIVSKDGFAYVAGLYELGLGISVTGITMIVSCLLYAGATSFIPFVMKKMFSLLKFIFKLIVRLLKRLYKYSTQL